MLINDDMDDIEQMYLYSIVSVLCNELYVIDHDVDDIDIYVGDKIENDDV